ncbi:hypothetical protein [Jeotgalicoccus psychrophilus]|uniref:hypothetical protein n=1 Tax=Jeotgalicoccus psychrophilus TaxID=157228 RepID=UPI00041BA653|nr:hypothetical protein [Jeotgalicoccus psychrophilus]
MSSSPKKWRTSDGEQRETETIDIYKYTNYYDLLLEYPSIGNLLSAAEFYEFQANYNDSKK